ncbi:hypothetical protein ACHAXR_012261 [Thalassiosira sp. AJA248-18]
MAKKEFARSDRAADGRTRGSMNDGLHRGSTTNDNDTSTASFPIKNIAFKVPGGTGDTPNNSKAVSKNSSESSMSSAQLRAQRQQQEEFEAIKREARVAGLHACKLAQMGIVPGVIYNDGETTKVTTCLTGSFGDAKKRKTKKKKPKKNAGEVKVDDTTTHSNIAQSHFGRRGEEKVEEDDDISVPMTFDTRTATTSPTEADNVTSASESSKSSFFDPKRLFKKSQKKKNHNKRTPAQNHEEALNEAKDLFASGAWMCGVCGTPFFTSENASYHEKLCLVEWLKHDKLVRQAWRDQGKPKNTTDVPIMFHDSKQSLNYPEYLPPRTGGEIPLSSPLVKKYLLMTDEALVNVARRQNHILHEVIDRDLCALSLKKQKAREDPSAAALDDYTGHDKRIHEDLFIWEREYDALRELELSSRDRHYYANLEQRAMERRYGCQPHLTHHDYYYHRLNRIRHAGSEAFNIESSPGIKESEQEKDNFSLKAKVWGGIKGRFDHAYKLVKEGPTSPTNDMDNKRQTQNDGESGGKKREMKHDNNTLYINVVVKNSVSVVNNELQRIARGWWQTELNKSGDDQADQQEVLDFHFEWIRAHTQKHVIRLAGMALASDFTPRKVAVQLSKDLYSNLVPQLKPRGVDIQAVIEYREGQYFVLAVNILEIDWVRLMAWVAEQQVANPNISLGQSRKTYVPGASPQKKKKKEAIQDRAKAFLANMRHRFPSRNEVVAYHLFFMYRIHVFIAVPLLRLWYLFMKYPVNKFILNAVTDDIFHYVEKKGMEMQLGIKRNNDQASFMLAALREIRNGDRKIDDEEDEDARPIIGPLMGPAVKDDNSDAGAPPLGLEFLEFIGLEVDLPVGFLRLRWALLHTTSSFLKDAFLADVMKYDKIDMGKWSNHEDAIGLAKTPDGIDEGSFLNATLEYSYLMPKSAFVKANMCYATLEIIHYDNNCLVLKEKTLTPEVPYGNTFIAWTQYSIVNTGKNTCRMVCSVEAEFPNGAPMVARQIKSGMRSGTAEKFISLGETVCRYADAFP